MTDWDKRFLDLAEYISKWSKDPSQKVGAVIVDKNRRVLSVGFNGLPRDVEDSYERLNNKDLKLSLIVHAEVNAILFSNCNLTGSTLYVSLVPCSRCAGLIIQSGISKIVCPRLSDNVSQKWKDSYKLSMSMFKESGVEVKEL